MMRAIMIYELRAYLCELLASWSLAMAPKGYVQGSVLAAADMYHNGFNAGRDEPCPWCKYVSHGP